MTNATPAPATVIVAGYAQLPQTTGAGVMWRHLTLIAKVRTIDGHVEDVDTTLATRIADEFLRSVLVGRRLDEEEEAVVETIERQYFGNGRKAMISAFRDMVVRYRESVRQPDVN